MGKKKPAPRGPFSAETIVLQALIEGEAYGREIRERLKTRTGNSVKIGESRLYPTLWKLEREGLLKSREGDPSAVRGGRPRKYYALTAEGLRRARDEAQTASHLFGLVPLGVK